MNNLLFRILNGLSAVIATVLVLLFVIVAAWDSSPIGKNIFSGLAGDVALVGAMTALPALILTLRNQYLGAAAALAVSFYVLLVIFWLNA